VFEFEFETEGLRLLWVWIGFLVLFGGFDGLKRLVLAGFAGVRVFACAFLSWFVYRRFGFCEVMGVFGEVGLLGLVFGFWRWVRGRLRVRWFGG
jgi:hypothetical protein